MFNRPVPAEPSNPFPKDALVIIIPKALLDRVLTGLLAVAAFGVTVQITPYVISAPFSPVPMQRVSPP
jgi:hypothetical protein